MNNFKKAKFVKLKFSVYAILSPVWAAGGGKNSKLLSLQHGMEGDTWLRLRRADIGKVKFHWDLFKTEVSTYLAGHL